MAVTAKFAVDFTDFQQAVNKAEVTLKTFGEGANAVGKRLETMSNSLTGKNVVQTATVMVQAIEKVGGVSALTQKELQRVGGTVTEAIEKMRALGVVVPESFHKIAQAAAEANKPVMDLVAGMSAFGKASAENAAASNRLIAGMSSVGKATQEAAQGGSTLGSVLSKATPILGAFGVSLGIGALVQFGRTLLDDADALQRMSDRTGIGVEGLQRLQQVGDDAGNTIEEMTGAINQMQNRLAGGDKSAVGSLEKLGLNLEQFLRLNPDKQFIAISDAIRQIEDPAEQVAVAMDLFGKTGAQVLPSLKKGFDDVKDAAVGMSRESVEALDTVGDTLAKWWRQAKGITAEAALGFAHIVQAGFDPMKLGMQNAEREMEAMRRALKDAMSAADKAGPAFKGAAPPGLPEDLEHIYAVLDRQKDAFNNANEAAKKAAAETKKLAEEEKKLREELDKQNWKQVTDSIEDSEDAAVEAAKAIGQQFAPQLKQLKVELGITAIESKKTSDAIGLIPDRTKQAADRIKKDLGEAPTAFQKFTGAIQTAAGAVDTVLSGINNKFAQFATTAARTATTVIKAFSTGDWIGGIAAGVSGAISMFSKLFKNAEKEINPLRKAFVDAAGGLDKLRDKATDAGVTINALLNAKNVKEYEKAIKDLQDAFDEHQQDIDRARELMDEYGISIEQTGQKWRNQEFSKQAEGLMNDLRILVDVLGLSMPDAIDKMSGKFNEFVQNAITFGFELPQQMKPILQQMIDLGKLTDKNGEAYESLEETGLTFTESFGHAVDRLIEKFDEFLQRLGLAAQGINSLPDSKTIHIDYDVAAAPVPGFARGGVVMPRYYQGGGHVLPFRSRGTDTVPAMLSAGEGVVTRAGMRRIGAGGLAAINHGIGSGGGDVAAAIRELMLSLPQSMARAVRDEVQKVSRAR